VNRARLLALLIPIATASCAHHPPKRAEPPPRERESHGRPRTARGRRRNPRATHRVRRRPAGAAGREQHPEPVPKAEPKSAYGNLSPYTVLGRTYTVRESCAGYVERGIASWYGTKFHGHLTSNRETTTCTSSRPRTRRCRCRASRA
jgi:rare lipoprotein A